MKTGLSMFLCWALLVFSSPALKADVVGDIDNDGKVGLPEAVNALEVTAGLKTLTDDGIFKKGEYVWNFSWKRIGKDEVNTGTLKLVFSHIALQR